MDITLQPAVLRWARERAGLSIAELAEKLKLKEDKIVAWEDSGKITFSRAERLAHVTHTPLGYLFLNEPIADELPIRDFRTVEMQNIYAPSVDLLDVIYDALERQDWYREYIVTNGGEPLAFVGSIHISLDAVRAAKNIRSVINWPTTQTTHSTSWEHALNLFIDAVRNAGILVIRSGIVGNNTHRPLNVSEFRGFSLSDNYAPLIFINGNDAKAAQIFTLAHELVHIWLGESGISNLSFTYSPDFQIERFCNNVAAELLVPSHELIELLASEESSSDIVLLAARYFRVSKLVILRRLRDVDYLSESIFQSLYADELAQINQRNIENKGGGDFYVTTRARLGDRFLYALLGSVLEGRMPYQDAMRLLGISKAETIQELSKQMGMAV